MSFSLHYDIIVIWASVDLDIHISTLTKLTTFILPEIVSCLLLQLRFWIRIWKLISFTLTNYLMYIQQVFFICSTVMLAYYILYIYIIHDSLYSWWLWEKLNVSRIIPIPCNYCWSSYWLCLNYIYLYICVCIYTMLARVVSITYLWGLKFHMSVRNLHHRRIMEN